MHFFGKKNRLPNSPELQQLNIKDAIGKTIVCEDGIPRSVKEICFSYRWPWKAIVNEQDESSNAGHFVNLFSLSSQLLGHGVPDKHHQEAFARTVRVQFKVSDQGVKSKHPFDEGGLIVYPTRKLD